MDLETKCKEKLSYFRIKELKDVLTQLGLSKQGKKQELLNRILILLSDEQAARLWSKKSTVPKEEIAKAVDDIYRKMQISGEINLPSKGFVSSDTSNLKVKGEPEVPFEPEIKVRCVCGSSLETNSMIQCEDPRCHVWEHVGCVIVPEKPMDENPPLPESFYCEICRLTRADPFWVTMAHPLSPVRLTAKTIPIDDNNTIQSVERTFQITRADKDLLAKQEYDVQAWCMLLNDKVLFRMQWPQYADLQVNGIPVRAINRPGSQLLGANGRDDGPIITPCITDGNNRISLSGGDNRIFCFGVRLVKRRTLQEVLNLIQKETEGEMFEDALARVRRCVGGGGGGGDDNDDSDSDIEVVADFFGVNLRCPMSGSRIKVAGRFLPCLHMGCFDLEVFVEMNQRSRKWQCPICLKNYSVEHLTVDPYFNRITSKMKDCDGEVAEIEVKPDGSWRVKSKKESECRELGELSQWHSPDGSLYPSADEIKPKTEMLIPVKQEGFSDSPTPLKFDIRKNRNGNWEVSKPNTNGSSSNNRRENVGYQEKHIIPMSSSTTGSGRDGDDASVNQDAIGAFDFGTNGIELDTNSMNVDSGYSFPERNQSGEGGNNEVIVLSDSDEENDVVIIPGPVYSGCRTDDGVNFPLNPPGIINSYNEDPHAIAGGNSSLGLFQEDDEFDMALWSFPSETPEASRYPLFASDADVSEGLVGLHHHGSLDCAPEINEGYTMAPETSIASDLVGLCSAGKSEVVANDGLVDNPLAFGFGRDDPSLQIFLPTKPDASSQSGFKNQTDISNGIRSDDWISLRLGDSACENHGEPANSNEINSNQLNLAREGSLDSTTKTASLLMGLNENRENKAKKQRLESDNQFSFPRQKCSKN